MHFTLSDENFCLQQRPLPVSKKTIIRFRAFIQQTVQDIDNAAKTVKLIAGQNECPSVFDAAKIKHSAKNLSLTFNTNLPNSVYRYKQLYSALVVLTFRQQKYYLDWHF